MRSYMAYTPAVATAGSTIDWPLKIFRQLLRRQKLNARKFLTRTFNVRHLATRRNAESGMYILAISG